MKKLSREEELQILNWVYSTIGSAFGRKEQETPSVLETLPRCGAFVTLHLKERLRGCIGFIEGREELRYSLKEAGHSAAFRDPRFPPLTEEEWEEADLEISLLSPMEAVDSADDLIMGTHGALLESGIYRGLFLPQVATEQGWDRDTFMDHLSMKAGLPAEFWRSGSYSLYSFTAQVFGMKKGS
ncbi:MAG: AmmeMemoRadiSam system protein A [Spirochaetales bacterium]|nr:AmmeMemoRadiSam system protein A [Spirochaetales bacterium]